MAVCLVRDMEVEVRMEGSEHHCLEWVWLNMGMKGGDGYSIWGTGGGFRMGIVEYGYEGGEGGMGMASSWGTGGVFYQ